MAELEVVTDKNNLISTIRAELDVQITTAQAFPRNLKEFLSAAKDMVTINEEIAADCTYAIPRKNKKTGKQEFIKGPGIRLAEILYGCYKNLHTQTRILEINEKTVKVEGVGWDLQNNNKIQEELIENINGTFSDAKKLATASASSKVFRNIIFRLIPRAYVTEIQNVAIKYAIGDQKTLPTKIKGLISRFQQMGIEQEKILAFFGKDNISDFTLSDAENLIGIGVAIKEGHIKIDAAFSMDEENSNMNAEDRVQHLLANKNAENKE